MAPSSSIQSVAEEKGKEAHLNHDGTVLNPDDEFGGTEERRVLERKLLLKVDLRMSILIFIYILNYVSIFPHSPRHHC